MGKASFWQRLAAFGFDFAFAAGVMLGINLVTLQMSQYFPQLGRTSGPYTFFSPSAAILSLLFMAAYFAAEWALWGQTPGMMALNIRVVQTDGARLGWKRAFVVSKRGKST